MHNCQSPALVQPLDCNLGWHVSYTKQFSPERNLVQVIHPRRWRRQACRAKAAAKSKVPLVEAPPEDFDFRAATASTQDIVQSRYPQLVDLVDTGILVAVPRRADYVERREDGYREPELVLLVGTAHVSLASAEATRRVIEAVRPDNVVVELCRSRIGAMYDPEPHKKADTSKSGQNPALSMRLQSLQRSVKDALAGGSSLGLMRLLLDGASSRIEQQAGVRSGIETKAAWKAAEAVGAQVILGDRPIEITLQRAWDALSWRRRWELILALASSQSDPAVELTPEKVEELNQDDAVAAMTQELARSYPEVASALLYERDLYLAWSLKRSKAVNGCRTVVGVLGRGHLRGVVYHLKQNSSRLRYRDLAGSKRGKKNEQSSVPGWVTTIAWNVALAAGLQVAWQAVTQHHL